MVKLKYVLAHISISLFVVICNNIIYNRKSQTPPPTKSNNSPRLFNQLN